MAPKKKAATAKKSSNSKASKAKPKPKLKAKAKPKAKAKATKPAKKKVKKPARKPARSSPDLNEAAPMVKGRGARTAGQSGDTTGLSDEEDADSESVEELVEEGQDFEAEIVDAVENAPNADEGELDAEPPAEDDDPDAHGYSKRNRL
jgi:hypothetical protein